MKQIERYTAYYEASDSASLTYTLRTHNYIKSGRFKTIDLHDCVQVNTVEAAGGQNLVWNPRKHNICLNVSGCTYLDTLKLAGNQAQVNASHCDSLEEANFISVKPIQIHADHCSKLKQVKASTIINTSLDFTSDSSLQSITFSSAPYLTSVDFTGCRNLKYFCTKV